jgi:multidrug resistance efflux pump
MKRFNLLYVSIIVTGIILVVELRPSFHRELSFYGFASSRSTEINSNYPVVVEQVLVKPGQEVEKGEVLLHVSRRKSKETLEDQTFRIAELKAEEALWKQKQKNDIEELKTQKKAELTEINTEIESLENELIFKKSLVEGLTFIEPAITTYKPLEQRITKNKQKAIDLKRILDLKINGLETELSLGQSPYNEQVKRLLAEKKFDKQQQVVPIVVTAPTNGLVGNISCKEAEHISSYTTLLTFYEPHSGRIKGFIHEDLTLKVELGQEFLISSLKDEDTACKGKVVGLGSRIVEIPSRLRKIKSIKVYGREVLIEIPKNNPFLQQEKVCINFIRKYNSKLEK